MMTEQLRHRRRAQKRYLQKLRREGRCVRCTHENDRLPKCVCYACACKPKHLTIAQRVRDNRRQRDRNAQLRAKGICVECRGASQRFWRCGACRRALNAHRVAA